MFPRPARAPILLTATLILAALLSACQRAESPAANPSTKGTAPYTIVATTGMITDIARRVAADRAEVIGLINSGIDPHLYQPTRDDIARLVRADIVLYNGLLLEGKMTDALVRVASGTEVVAVAAEIDESALLSPPDYEGHPDPHVWMDPLLWIEAVETVAATLAAHDPDGADTYRANADQLIGEIRALHDYAADALGSIPEPQRVLVTAHDAFGYFGARYGLEVVGIQGISTESEAGVRDIERIVELLVAQRIGAVFVETTVSERNIRALIAGANDRGHTVRVGGSLYSDAMGPAGTYEGTYIGMIDHNVTTIARALGGDAQAGGLNGKLTTPETPQESP